MACTGVVAADSCKTCDCSAPFSRSRPSTSHALALILPGGAMRDHEVIAAADEAGLARVFSGVRQFRH